MVQNDIGWIANEENPLFAINRLMRWTRVFEQECSDFVMTAGTKVNVNKSHILMHVAWKLGSYNWTSSDFVTEKWISWLYGSILTQHPIAATRLNIWWRYAFLVCYLWSLTKLTFSTDSFCTFIVLVHLLDEWMGFSEMLIKHDAESDEILKSFRLNDESYEFHFNKHDSMTIMTYFVISKILHAKDFIQINNY